ncbi:hypothetical protein BDC45DRAFT_355871 [Circinella umbellata]|nr:hypothetical protein BDC45DRAFT_355531 [Circinella umbellata]KAI7847388.1 hypothetical protein BDC45DRAFT_355871 [Circinella umbellata]
MAHMKFIYEFNCIADEILAHESPSEQPVDDDDTDLHQTEMEWEGNPAGIQSLYQFGAFNDGVDEEMVEVVLTNVEASVESRSVSKKVTTGKKRETRGSKYNSQQIQQLFDYVIEMGMTAKAASLLVGIKVRTVQYYVHQYKIENEMTGPKPMRKKLLGRSL